MLSEKVCLGTGFTYPKMELRLICVCFRHVCESREAISVIATLGQVESELSIAAFTPRVSSFDLTLCRATRGRRSGGQRIAYQASKPHTEGQMYDRHLSVPIAATLPDVLSSIPERASR